jgi:hypothetical protein
MWLRCLSERNSHAIDYDGANRGAGFVAAVCGTSVYPLDVAKDSHRRCPACVDTLLSADAVAEGARVGTGLGPVR